MPTAHEARPFTQGRRQCQENGEVMDVIIIGGGPAGMLAALRAGYLGAKTVLK